MNKKSIFLSICALMLSIGSFAQVKISAEVRPRSEYNHGVRKPAGDGQEASILTSQRTRLNLNYKNEVFAIGVVFQDVRLWGQESQLTSNGNNVTYIHEAWAEWFMTKQFSLKGGRQQLVYDDHRILGSVGWAQQARSHDLALFKYTGTFSAHLGLAYNNSNLHDNYYGTMDEGNNFQEGPDAYKAMQFLWLNHKSDSYSASVLFLNNGKPYAKETDPVSGVMTKQGIRYSKTLGTHLKTKISDVKLAGNFYYQFGEDAGGKDLSAINFSVDATMPLGENAAIGAGYELLSGTDQSEVEKNNSFAPLYGTNHKFNGFMDYFYVGGGHVNSVGLNDIYVKGHFKPGKVKFNGAIHFFSADGEITDHSKGLGTEVDLWCGYSHKGQVQLDFGYSHMFAQDALYAIKGVEKNNTSNNWAWVMLTFKPTLFEKK